MFDVIERLKAEWTDKYVVIDSPAPELARFARTTGQVRTVNMNGRCLVEFDQYNNIGWYDIDPACLKIVPKPLPKPAEPKEKAAKPAAKPAASTATKPAAKPAAAGAKKPSTADILAAARGKAAAPPKAAAAPVSAPEAEAEPAVAPQKPEAPQKSPPPKKAAGGLPTTTAEKIAWCRTNDNKG
ncbi:MAG: hypothetical protein K8S94_17580 [Planctomycetia bacterium]|nr:hypothetical protein [Planctomycetia bacterium]